MKHVYTTNIPAYSIENEPYLLSCIAEGDENAFKFLYNHYAKELKPLLKKYNSADIELQEIFQETFLKLWLNRDALTDIQNFRAWIYKVASREYLIALRKRLNYDKRLTGYSSNIINSPTPQTPVDAMIYSEVHHFILKTIAALPPRRRTIYEMNRQGFKIGEIAEQLSISPQTVKNVLLSASKTVREELIAIGYGPFMVMLFLFFFSRG